MRARARPPLPNWRLQRQQDGRSNGHLSPHVNALHPSAWPLFQHASPSQRWPIMIGLARIDHDGLALFGSAAEKWPAGSQVRSAPKQMEPTSSGSRSLW